MHISTFGANISMFRCFVFLAVFAMTGPAFSQSYLSRVYTERDGLPSSHVTGLAQGENGIMWFATRRGAASYDSKIWRRHSSGQGGPFDQALKIEVAQDGIVWAFGGGSGAVSFWDGLEWKDLPPVKLPDPNVILRFKLMRRQERTVPTVGVQGGGVYIFERQEWRYFGTFQGLQSDVVTDLDAVGDRLFVATDAGLSVITEDGIDNSYDRVLPENRQELYAVKVEQIASGVLAKPSQRVWLLGPGWLGYIQNSQFTEVGAIPEVDRALSNNGAVLFPDGQNGVFCGRDAALFHYTPRGGGIVPFGIEQGLVDEGATSILRDREGNMWFAGVRGVSVLPGMTFANYRRDQGLLEDEVSAVLEIAPGQLMLGHDTGLTLLGLDKTETLSFQPDSLPRDTGLRVMDLTLDEESSVWGALSRQGVFRRSQDGTITRYPSDHAVYAVLYDNRRKQLWIGGEEGLSQIDGDRVVTGSDASLDGKTVRRMHLGRGGEVYFATAGWGVYVWGKSRRQIDLGTVEANNVFSVFEDSRYRLLVGTLGGLYLVEDDQVRPYDDGYMQIDRPVYFINEDRVGRIWVGTDHGLYLLDGHNGRHYTVNDGLAGDETNRAAGFVDSSGGLWIGTNSGLSRYLQEFDHQNTQPPIMSITGIQLDGKALAPGKPITIARNGSDLTIHFRAVSFIDEARVAYATRLNGYEDTWHEASGSYQRYTNLDLGTYTFEVKARNAAGLWSEPLSLEIRRKGGLWLLSPPYIYFLVTILVLLLYQLRRRHRVQQLKKERRDWQDTRKEQDARFDALISAMNEEIELSGLLDMLLEQSLALCRDAERGLILLLEPDSGAFRFAAAAGYHLPDLEGNRFDFATITDGFADRSFLAEGIYHFPREDPFFSFKVRKLPVPESRLVITLILEGKIRGMLLLDSRLRHQNPDGDELLLLGRLRTHAVTALTKVRFLETLREKNREILTTQRQLVLREKMASLGTLTTGLAHEIRNPLNFINNFANLNLQIIDEFRVRLRALSNLGEEKLEPLLDELDELEDGAKIIHDHGSRACKIIESMIQFSAFSDRVDDRGPIDLGRLLEEQAAAVLMTMNKQHPLPNLRVHNRVDPNLPPYEGNQETLVFLFSQLFTNAYEALIDRAQKNPDFLPILSYRMTRVGDAMHIKICDNGPGVSPAHGTKIFAPFFTTRDQNIGLGLFMCYEIVVNAYRGDLVLERHDAMTEAQVLLPIQYSPRLNDEEAADTNEDPSLESVH